MKRRACLNSRQMRRHTIWKGMNNVSGYPGPFGGMFDLNGDGRTDPDELSFGYMILQDLENPKSRRSSWDMDDDEDDDDDE